MIFRGPVGDEVASQLGKGLGEALSQLEQIMLGLATLCTIVAWMALLSGPGRPTRRALGLLAVLVVHLLPLLIETASATPTDWSFAGQWRAWGAAGAWSVPGLLALLWALGWLDSPRATRRARGLATLLYLALVGLSLHRHRPPALPEPLVEIVATSRGSTACGRTAAGVVYCMGDNHAGQLAPGDHRDLERPRRIDALTPASRIFLAEHTSCATIGPSTVRCLGRRDGASDSQWEATSAAEIADLIVGSAGDLVFVAANGDVAAESGLAPGPIAAATREHRQCCDTLWLRSSAGEWQLHTPMTGQSLPLADATAVACYRDDRLCAPAWLANGRLHVSTAETTLELAVPPDAALIDTPAGLDLRSATQRAVCKVHPGGWSSSEALECTWGPLESQAPRSGFHPDSAAAIMIDLNRSHR